MSRRGLAVLAVFVAACLLAVGCTSASPAEATEPIMVRSEYGTDPSQFGNLSIAAVEVGELAPVVVLVHGGFWRQQFDLTLMDDLVTDVVARGYASWNIEYRRVGGQGGWPMTGDDVGAAIDQLAVLAIDYPIDLDRVVLVGHSAGGHLALWSLGRPDAVVEPVGAVGLGAVVSLGDFRESVGLLGGTIDQVSQVYADASPVLDPLRVALVQGAADRIIPPDTLAPAEDAGVPIVTIENDNHFDLIDPDSASWAATIDFVRGFLT